MFNKILYKILDVCKPPSDLEIVLGKIAKQESIRNANLVMDLMGKIERPDISKDLHFMVGSKKHSYGILRFDYFKVLFSDDDSKCIVTMQSSNEPLFAFSDPKEVAEIRKAVVNKYNQMLETEKANKIGDFRNM